MITRLSSLSLIAMLTSVALCPQDTMSADTMNVPPHDLTTFPKNTLRTHAEAGTRVFVRGQDQDEAPSTKDDRQWRQLQRQSSLVLGRGFIDTNNGAYALLADDPSVGFPLRKGETCFLVKLEERQVVRYMSLLNSVEGRSTLSVSYSLKDLSIESDEWIPLKTAPLSTDKPYTVFDFGNVELRYLKLHFVTQEAQRIAGLGTYGAITMFDWVQRHKDAIAVSSVRKKTPVDINLASFYSGASVRYVSSATRAIDAGRLIDDDPITGMQFLPEDELPTVVVDLGVPRLIDRVTMVSASVPGTVRVSLRPASALREADDEEKEAAQRNAPAPQGPQQLEMVLPPELESPTLIATRIANLPASPTSPVPVDPEREDKRTPGYFEIGRIDVKEKKVRKSFEFEPTVVRFIRIEFEPEKRANFFGNTFFLADVAAFGQFGGRGPSGLTDVIEDPIRERIPKRPGVNQALSEPPVQPPSVKSPRRSSPASP